ncbi:unnamed protein product [Protopolystoma xenopodis]|uniref:Uncharacterized protein n=1 Tax=Protopolystoma xenopodis TaxID=117903 RepID=A0A448WSB2_9PLAT|nr:unnamed protein product [Protopolystoma xenopodis]
MRRIMQLASEANQSVPTESDVQASATGPQEAGGGLAYGSPDPKRVAAGMGLQQAINVTKSVRMLARYLNACLQRQRDLRQALMNPSCQRATPVAVQSAKSYSGLRMTPGGHFGPNMHFSPHLKGPNNNSASGDISARMRQTGTLGAQNGEGSGNIGGGVSANMQSIIGENRDSEDEAGKAVITGPVSGVGGSGNARENGGEKSPTPAFSFPPKDGRGSETQPSAPSFSSTPPPPQPPPPSAPLEAPAAPLTIIGPVSMPTMSIVATAASADVPKTGDGSFSKSSSSVCPQSTGAQLGMSKFTRRISSIASSSLTSSCSLSRTGQIPIISQTALQGSGR